MNRTAAELRSFVTAVLRAVGTPERQADCVAGHLVESSLRGIDTHGVRHLELYVSSIRAGAFRPEAEPKIIKETPASALVAGEGGWGIVAGEFAVDLAIDKARHTGIAVVGIVEADHMGRLGAYVERASAVGMVSSMWVGGLGVEKPLIAPFGGGQALLSGNPIAFGCPAKGGPGVVIDFLTMALISPLIEEAQRTGAQLPRGILIDADGRPTTEPGGWNGASIGVTAPA